VCGSVCAPTCECSPLFPCDLVCGVDPVVSVGKVAQQDEQLGVTGGQAGQRLTRVVRLTRVCMDNGKGRRGGGTPYMIWLSTFGIACKMLGLHYVGGETHRLLHLATTAAMAGDLTGRKGLG
jgi:hypothetical protein